MTDDLINKLNEIIDNRYDRDETIDLLTGMIERFPYFTVPATILIDRYSKDITEEQRQNAMKVIAVGSADPTTLYRLTDRRAQEFENFYPPEPEKERISTEDAITTFLRNYGNDSPEENELLEKLIFNPVPDYASVLSAQEDESQTIAPDDDTSLKINAFIESHPDSRTHSDVPSPETRHNDTTRPSAPQPDSLLSESLAKIYIKQRRYDKAFEIITQLSLNYPEKSCYFADQLRFLKKLIINQKYTKQNH